MTNDLTALVARLRRLLAEATPLPWESAAGPLATTMEQVPGYAWESCVDSVVFGAPKETRGQCKPSRRVVSAGCYAQDAALAVAAVNALPALIDALGQEPRRCLYCGGPHPVSDSVFEESPYCSGCLHERVAARAEAKEPR